MKAQLLKGVQTYDSTVTDFKVVGRVDCPESVMGLLRQSLENVVAGSWQPLQNYLARHGWAFAGFPNPFEYNWTTV